MAYNISKSHSIQMKCIRQFGRNQVILGQYHLAQLSRSLKFSTETSTRTNSPSENGNLGHFLSQFKSFKPLMERSNLGILIDLEDYKEKKKQLKESLKNLEDELASYDNKTLLGILLLCLEMSEKCLNDSFNLTLVELLISRFQSVDSTNNRLGRKITTSDTTTGSTSTSTSSTFTGDIKNGVNASNQDFNLSEQNNILGLDYSFISKILDDEVHLVYLLSGFLKLKLHANLENHFEYFYISLNRNIGNYSSENLVRLCRTLGDLYYFTSLGGIKILVQKCLYSLLEQIDKYGVNVSVHSWIQLINAINKCNENHLFKKLVPYLTATIQSSPFTNKTSNFHYFDPKTDMYKISKEETKKYYMFVKLNLRLLNTVLTTGIIENLNLFECIFQLISNYLLFHANKTSKLKSFNINNKLFNTSNYYNTNTSTSSEYNQPNEFVDELLYKKYNNKLFKSPSYTPPSTDLSGSQKSEESLLQYGLLNMLNSGNVSFVTGLKMNEMYMRTLYPSLYSKLSKNSLLQVIRELQYENEREYSFVSNVLNNNKELIQKHASDQDPPMIVLVDIYYLICTNYYKKVYVEIINGNNRYKNKNKRYKETEDEVNISNEEENEMLTNFNGYDFTTKTFKLSKQMEFKQQYLESLGWTCIQIYK